MLGGQGEGTLQGSSATSRARVLGAGGSCPGGVHGGVSVCVVQERI